MKLIVIVGLSLIITLQAVQISSHDEINTSFSAFQGFMKKYNKVYTSETELNKRFKIFQNNMKRAQELQKNQMGTAKYGATIFADLTDDEFTKRQGLVQNFAKMQRKKYPQAEIPNVKLPKNFDWRKKGDVVTPVKNQGNCGSCWTFSTTGNIEGQYALKYGSLLSFSEQEIVDCDHLDTGCSGGYPFLAYQAIEDIGGLVLEENYPYTAQDGNCSFNKDQVAVTLAGGLELSTDEDDIAKWLVQNGPVSIAINAEDMQLYQGGISNPKTCDKYNLNHAVLIVGYGVKKSKNEQEHKEDALLDHKKQLGNKLG
uniref:Cathepsin propeptide inhibitor domain-containing protein n=1 Tax=Clastoptera arizonana TaxID=38151 RepID=A0A1B6CRK3_9HEMI